MARIRTIKPEFFQDEALSRCSPHARLLAIALLQLCDAKGVFRHIPMQVHAHAFPWEAGVNSPALLGELEAIGYVKFYCVQGKTYGHIPGFEKHQRLTGKEAQSGGTFPGPDQADQRVTPSGDAGKHLGTSPSLPREAPRCPGTGNREQGTGNSTAGRSDAAKRDEYPTEFEQAWDQYPKRQGDNPKRRAFRAWNARLQDGATPQEMVAGVLRYARWCEATGKAGTELVKQAATFFGPDRAFLESWKPPEAGHEAGQRNRKLSPAEQVREDIRQLAAAGQFRE